MTPFTITFNEWEPRSGDVVSRCSFLVVQGELEFLMSIGVPHMLWTTTWSKLEEKDKKRLVLRVGLERLLKKLTSGDYPRESTKSSQEIILATDDEIEVDKYLVKLCKFQTKAPAGLVCKVAVENDQLQAKTCQPLCNECSIPDSDLLCSHLSHPECWSSVSQTSRSRDIGSAMCEKGRDPANTSECKPGGQQCWQLVFEPAKVAQEIPTDLPDRVADEIDFLNLAFVHVHSKRILELSQARSISDLYGSCATEQDFMFKVAVIADLVNKLSMADALSEEERDGIEGSVNLLEVYLNKFHQGFGDFLISNLRSIVDVRNSFPVHSKSKRLIKSFELLDIEYPVYHWQKAWEKVLFAFWSSLRKLRRLTMSEAR
ncbi:hypothetical protein HKBW3S43_00558 [Candidatus Hakubella thermalkaliphila]|nr:hypothetical protein [Candidatus Hakubella thermalkaliphila]GFP28217.1 hypothetical protein HKBW3S33_01633 [Candidatus Hakubella thermalkaliphila]GFP34766.1 hypothetical protein HKBW3S43_00558 [Candidatus Hakubella thermalkaliphila]GFP43602.1 hypothetical protein HKBW3C_02732 [Candidatus Hakubella thermalkaliphila]